MAAPRVVGDKCMYFIVVVMWLCPASSWIASGGAPSAASIEQNV